MPLSETLDAIGRFADLQASVVDYDEDYDPYQVDPEAVGNLIAEEFGLVSFGHGHYSVVLSHPTDENKVIKIGLNEQEEDGWTRFAMQAMLMPSSPYLPVIYSLRMFNQVFVAEIEKLKPIKNNYDWADSGTLSKRTDENYIKWLAHVIDHLWGEEPDEFTVEGLNAFPQHDPAFVMWLAAFNNHAGLINDLGVNNVMLRGNTFVLTDPYSNTSTVKAKVDFRKVKKQNGIRVILAGEGQDGQKPIRKLYKGASSRNKSDTKGAALRPESVNAVQQKYAGLSRLLSQVRYKSIPQGTDISARLRQTARSRDGLQKGKEATA